MRHRNKRVGALTVTVSGLPAGTSGAETPSGPSGCTRVVTNTETLAGLLDGSYTANAENVAAGGTVYSLTPASQSIPVSAGAASGATVAYAAPAGAASLNLSTAGLHITQSVQRLDGTAPTSS